jgi:hypothetical protein
MPTSHEPHFLLFNIVSIILYIVSLIFYGSNANHMVGSASQLGRIFLHQLSSHLESHLNCYFF